jgi:hypothetical protein
MATKGFLAAKFRAYVGINALVHGSAHMAKMTASTDFFAHYWQQKLQDPLHFHAGTVKHMRGMIVTMRPRAQLLIIGLWTAHTCLYRDPWWEKAFQI